MNTKNEKMLKAYVATSGYTIRALEDAIIRLKDSIEAKESPDLVEIYKGRIDELQEYLYIITNLD